MKSTANDLHIWKLTQNGPKGFFKVECDSFHQWPDGHDIQNSFENTFVVQLFSARHQNEKQRDLFGVVICPHKCIDCQQLAEWVTTEFKGTIHIPTSGTTQNIKLFISGKE